MQTYNSYNQKCNQVIEDKPKIPDCNKQRFFDTWSFYNAVGSPEKHDNDNLEDWG